MLIVEASLLFDIELVDISLPVIRTESSGSVAPSVLITSMNEDTLVGPIETAYGIDPTVGGRPSQSKLIGLGAKVAR